MTEAGCPFCNYEGPSEVLHDWGDAYAINPIDPVAEGHVLIIPKAHVVSYTCSPPTTALTMQRAAEWAAVNTLDSNLITSDGAVATQTVKHLHVHVVPRREGDGLALPWSPSRQRWEQEVRERLTEKVDELIAELRRTNEEHYHGGESERKAQMEDALSEAEYQATGLFAIFGEAEPVGDCKTCGGKGIIHTGECREAMSGPTCRNPACPPCNTPETEPCPDCQADAAEGEGR
jgi:histidine triad (HIT) family protein